MRFIELSTSHSKLALSATTAMLMVLTACDGLVPAGDSQAAPPPVDEIETVADPPPAPAAPEIAEPVLPSEPAVPDLGKVPEVSDPSAAPKIEAPPEPPVEMGDQNELAPEVETPVPAIPEPQVPQVEPKAPTPANPAPASPSTVTPPPPPSAGFSNLQLELAGNNNNLANYLPGITTCEGLLESILERDDNAGSSTHTIGVDVRELGGSAAGVATTPPPNFYDAAVRQGLSLSLDDDLDNQYGVCAVFVHEVFHTFGVGHTGDGIMSPTLSGNTLYIDGPIANAFGRIGYRFVDSVQAKLDSGQRVPLADLVQDYTNTTAQELQAQST